MNHDQQRALALLEQVTPERITSRNNRVAEFLCSPAQKPSYTLRPEQWTEGWCKGWTFAVPPTMATALDIQLTPRVIDGHKRLEWTQGSRFDFCKGYTIHDVPEAWTLPWGEALKSHAFYSIQIISATPAEPATPDKRRNPGQVEFCICQPNANRTAVDRHESSSVTQDAFVRILICGLN